MSKKVKATVPEYTFKIIKDENGQAIANKVQPVSKPADATLEVNDENMFSYKYGKFNTVLDESLRLMNFRFFENLNLTV